MRLGGRVATFPGWWRKASTNVLDTSMAGYQNGISTMGTVTWRQLFCHYYFHAWNTAVRIDCSCLYQNIMVVLAIVPSKTWSEKCTGAKMFPRRQIVTYGRYPPLRASNISSYKNAVHQFSGPHLHATSAHCWIRAFPAVWQPVMVYGTQNVGQSRVYGPELTHD